MYICIYIYIGYHFYLSNNSISSPNAIAVGALLMYVTFFSLGMGAIPWSVQTPDILDIDNITVMLINTTPDVKNITIILIFRYRYISINIKTPDVDNISNGDIIGIYLGRDWGRVYCCYLIYCVYLYTPTYS